MTEFKNGDVLVSKLDPEHIVTFIGNTPHLEGRFTGINKFMNINYTYDYDDYKLKPKKEKRIIVIVNGGLCQVMKDSREEMEEWVKRVCPIHQRTAQYIEIEVEV